jgi:CBS-domain-containing membrane protein
MKSKHLNDRQVRQMAPYETHLAVSKGHTIIKMVKQITEHPAKHYLCVVDEEGKLQGLINRKKIFQVVFTHHVSGSIGVSQLFQLITSESADDLLIRHVFTAGEDDRIDKVIKTMIEHELVEVPVVDKNKKVIGLLTSGMLLKEWLSDESKEEE